MAKTVRIDKYLWAVRLFKTRTLATEACKRGKVTVDDMPAKPSRTITAGDVIEVKKMPVVYSYRVKDPIEKRVGAKIVDQYMENITTQEELQKLEMQDDFFVKRDRGAGRPTKKERRLLDDIQDIT
ncbi:MAG: RNA-binding S4 domain-containing protein [Bacteroidales bacterium]|nr:RNA-binding S4 domain-containing protein [Bacteroidales bacterium]